MDQILKKMATTGKGQVAINQSVLTELKKQNPQLPKILNPNSLKILATKDFPLPTLPRIPTLIINYFSKFFVNDIGYFWLFLIPNIKCLLGLIYKHI